MLISGVENCLKNKHLGDGKMDYSFDFLFSTFFLRRQR